MVDMVAIILMEWNCLFPSALEPRLLSYGKGAGTYSYTHTHTRSCMLTRGDMFLKMNNAY